MSIRQRILAPVVVISLALASCSQAPDPGNVAVFCSLLSGGSGLTDSPTAADLADLAAVAPPDIRSTITTLQSRARNFDELLAEQPPDLEALFNARFDPAAETERVELDDYAESACGLIVERPPATRWATYVRENHRRAAWVDVATTQFDVTDNRVSGVTVLFATAPEPIELVEQACQAAADFLGSESVEAGLVQVLIGAVVVLEHDVADSDCRLP